MRRFRFGMAAGVAALMLVGTAMTQDQGTRRARQQADGLRQGEDAIPARPGEGPRQRGGRDQGFYRASEILGSTVRGEGGEELGTIQDLLIDRQTQTISHFILGEEGEREITQQSNVRVVPWTVARPQFTQDQRIVNVPIPQQRFREAPAYTWQEIQAGPRGGWYGDVNRFYGVQPGRPGFQPGQPGRVEVERDGDVEIEGVRPGPGGVPQRERIEIDNY